MGYLDSGRSTKGRAHTISWEAYDSGGRGLRAPHGRVAHRKSKRRSYRGAGSTPASPHKFNDEHLAAASTAWRDVERTHRSGNALVAQKIASYLSCARLTATLAAAAMCSSKQGVVMLEPKYMDVKPPKKKAKKEPKKQVKVAIPQVKNGKTIKIAVKNK